MTILQLQYFQTLARVLHYTRAAEELHISQPSLSYSISELEKELGVKLFQKEGRKVEMTIYGQQFLYYAEKALALLQEGSALLKHLSAAFPQVVRLGYFHSISASFIPALVENFYAEKGADSVRFQFAEGPSYDIFEQVRTGELDLAFSLHRADWAESVSVMRQPLYLAVPSGHPLAERHSVTFEDFASEPQIMLEPSSSLRAQIGRVFSQRGTIPHIVFEVRECNAALQYVGLRFGVAVLPHVPAMESEKVAILPISDQDREFVRTIYLSWSRTRPLSPAAAEIRDFIVKQYSLPEG